jgi:hypothetical protein
VTKTEELARADRLVSESMDRILRLSANLDRMGAPGLRGFRLSLQVLATMHESSRLMVRHRDFIKLEASKSATVGTDARPEGMRAAGNDRSNSASGTP